MRNLPGVVGYIVTLYVHDSHSLHYVSCTCVLPWSVNSVWVVTVWLQCCLKASMVCTMAML